VARRTFKIAAALDRLNPRGSMISVLIRLEVIPIDDLMPMFEKRIAAGFIYGDFY
jgi:hypothetical protein